MVSGTRATEANGLLADYWVESRRPIASLAFIAPMLVAYEGGLIWLGNAGHYQFAFSLGAWRWGLVVGDAFSWTSFLFRAVAGVFFSVLFLYRGFGVAAGTHALYDIFATLV